jgi:hypothetical protein
MSIQVQVRCPACRGPLAPVQLYCDACDLTLSGRFVTNEFATLAHDDLHFLRIFVHCEGRIRDMESALGVSYPTIKARLARLKDSLTMPQMQAETEVKPAEEPTAVVLQELEAGRINFEQAMARLKELQR